MGIASFPGMVDRDPTSAAAANACRTTFLMVSLRKVAAYGSRHAVQMCHQ